jgi:2-keto-4-pentenoate hydratase/2-oxohepta-3-ene-1,7-dioic acid hydratase in catechol pathway
VEFEGDLFSSPRMTGRKIAKNAYALRSPCLPSKIVALWNNFHALSAKLGKQAPAHPLFLLKPASSVIGPADPIRRPTGYAESCIFGYTCVNDVTAAEVLNESPDFAQWCRSKGYDTFGCLGPVIATELDWRNARVVTKVDGTERQNYPLSDMIMPPAALVSLISHDMTLMAGDVIACGTSLGVGSIKDGASVEVAIDGIGALTNMLAPPR